MVGVQKLNVFVQKTYVVSSQASETIVRFGCIATSNTFTMGVSNSAFINDRLSLFYRCPSVANRKSAVGSAASKGAESADRPPQPMPPKQVASASLTTTPIGFYISATL
jgi:hypothetical protein